MASLIQGYEYDIFISYRQKDNKHDGWVTEFVDQLKGELESTFKEEISVYFDINPDDGILETYDVDASLKDKLKCLVFIPIISRTYCDPKSFAWEHEFKAFIEQASQDQFGLKIKLPNGNVASRVLPVRIHDLDNEDIKLCESVLGGVLRGVEFIYKEPGVDKPLAFDDNEKKNLNNTQYRIQIIKVAHSIKEIVRGLKTETDPFLKGMTQIKGSLDEGVIEIDIKRVINKSIIVPKSKRKFIVLLVVTLCIVGAFSLSKIIERTKQANEVTNLEKSIAVLPFINDSPNDSTTYFINGIMDEILNNLQKIKDFRILSRTSTEKYRGSAKLTIPKIAKELGVNYIIEGSGQKYGNKFVLRVQLIAAHNEKHFWGKSFEQEIHETNDIINIQSQIAQSIVAELKATMTPEEKQLIEKSRTTNLTAYDFYLRGKDEHTKYWLDHTKTIALTNAILYYKQALKSDSTFAQAYTGLAIARFNSYWKNVYNRMMFSENEMKIVRDSIITLVDNALKYNKKLEEAYLVRGMCSMDDDIRLKEFRKALEINPNYGAAFNFIAEVYNGKGENIDYIKNKLKSIELERGPLLPILLKDLGEWYENYGFSESAIDIYNQIFQLSNDTLQYFQNMSGPYYVMENWEESIRWAKKILEKNPGHLWAHSQLVAIYSFLGKDDSATYHIEKIAESNIHSAEFEYYRGFLFWEQGGKIKASEFFDRAVNFSDKLIKAGIDTDFNNFITARIFSIKGEKNKAMEYFSKLSIQFRRVKWVIISMERDPVLKNIRSDERFQLILKKSKSDWQAEHEKIMVWFQQNNLLKI